ncbi:MAG TPA: OmpA family protein [Acidobacteriota bacterium]|nr:OmpA family protein [Acidobacteriota bacterium]
MNFYRRLVPLLVFLLAAAACGERQAPPPPPPSADRSPTGSPDATPGATVAPPSVTLNAQPLQVRRGEPSLLDWEATSASQVTLQPGIGEVEAVGSLQVYPEQTTTYILNALGEGGSSTRSVTVEVLADEQGLEVQNIDPDLPLEERFKRAVKPVFFEFDEADLSAEARRTLDENIEWLTLPENLSVRFLVEGHCDQRGSDEYNLALGELRAQVVKGYLVRGGVDPARIFTVSYGEERPFATGDSEEDYALNRRAHFLLRP